MRGEREAMGKRYSKQEILALIDISEKYGNIFYINEFDIEQEFYLRTGNARKSGPLYMAFWRTRNGYYDHLMAG